MQIDRKTLVVAVMMVAFTALLRPAAVRAQQAAETAEAREAREVGEAREAREAREAAGVAISLGEAVRRLESSNPSLHAADWKARSAEREVWEARGELLPTLAASGDYTRYEESNLVTPMHEAPSPKSDPLEFEEEIYTAAAKLTVPLVNLPALSKAQSAKDAARAQAAQRDTLEQRLIASVVEVFVQAQQIDDSLSLIDAYLEALGERREELSELEREGQVSSARVAEVEAQMNSRRAERLELVGLREDLTFRLGELLGRDEPVTPQSVSFSKPELETRIGATGPKLEEARARLSAAESKRTATAFSFAPTLEGFFTQTSRSGPELDFSSEWSGGLTVTIPLFTGGRRAARWSSARADLQAAQSSYSAAKLGQSRALRGAARTWEIAGERQRLIEQAVANRETSVSSMRNRYEQGRTSLSDLLNEEASLLELRMNERRLLYDQVLAFVSYHQTAGDLSPELIQSLTEE